MKYKSTWWILVACSTLLLGACSGKVATCLKIGEEGRIDGSVSAGPYGSVLDMDIVGPGSMQRIPLEMGFNPCTQSPPENAIVENLEPPT